MPEQASAAMQLRYERKFVCEGQTRREVEHRLKMHPAHFREIYGARFVNNVYFDSPFRGHYWDSVEGSNRRLKVRVRWYGPPHGHVELPKLELKGKLGNLVWKSAFPLPGFRIQPGFDGRAMHSMIVRSNLAKNVAELVKPLGPVLLNSYYRRYFLSADCNYRLTVDDRMVSCPLHSRRNTLLHKRIDRDHVVIEVKYGRDCDEGAEAISGFLVDRVVRWSKYVNGLDAESVAA